MSRMTANQHYAEAERLLEGAESDAWPEDQIPEVLARAQVHATLALRLDK